MGKGAHRRRSDGNRTWNGLSRRAPGTVARTNAPADAFEEEEQEELREELREEELREEEKEREQECLSEQRDADDASLRASIRGVPGPASPTDDEAEEKTLCDRSSTETRATTSVMIVEMAVEMASKRISAMTTTMNTGGTTKGNTKGTTRGTGSEANSIHITLPRRHVDPPRVVRACVERGAAFAGTCVSTEPVDPHAKTHE